MPPATEGCGGGAERAQYGEALLARLSLDLTTRFGRGFSVDRLETARLFYLTYPVTSISATASRKSDADKSATPSRILADPPPTRFVLSWSHYVLLIRPRQWQSKHEKSPDMK
jgi:hypothetical protein